MQAAVALPDPQSDADVADRQDPRELGEVHR
jgi:hypothetical protein